jgi:UDP-3-O-acyl N-acetylglucosamine deacetylase
VRRHSYRYQRTIARTALVQGVGFLTGAAVRLRFQPAPPDTGLVFVRTDLKPPAVIAARLEQVTGTDRRTTLGRPPVQVGMVEHVLAALAGLRIDNCLIELDASEPPGLDGSAREYVQTLHRSGAVLQSARRSAWTVDAPVVVSQKGATLALHPAPGDGLKISYLLDYGIQSPIARQAHSQLLTPERFANDLACCRTFILEQDIVALKRQGLGPRTTLADLLVFGPRGPIHNRVRYGNEPARHKILDIVGDLSLLGQDVRGHLVAYRSGHQLNVALVQALSLQIDAAQTGHKAAA